MTTTMTTRRRKTKTYGISKGLLHGTGESATEAKADLNRQVDAALEGSYSPAIVTFDGQTIVVYREPQGWVYKRFDSGEITGEGITDVRWMSCGTHSRDDMIQQAAHHVISLSSQSTEYRTDADIPAFLTNTELRRSLITNARFQRAYRFAKESRPDKDSGDWHYWACSNCNDEQFH
jgi:hypothetical protein